MKMRFTLLRCVAAGTMFAFCALATAGEAYPVIQDPSATPPTQTYERTLEIATAYFTIGEYPRAEEELKKIFFMPGHSRDRYAMELLQRVRQAKANATDLTEGINSYESRNYSEAAAMINSNLNGPRAQRLLNKIENMRPQYEATVAEIQTAIEKGDSSFLYNSKKRQYSMAKETAEQALTVPAYKDDLRLTQLKNRAEAAITALEERKEEADKNASTSSNKYSDRINKEMDELLDKWF